MSFRLEEIAKNLTTGRGKGFFFIFEPLLMSKQVFDSLPKDQQAAIMEVGLEMEKFGLEKSKEDDVTVARGLREGRHQDLRSRPGAGRQVEGGGARHLLEGLRREVGEQRRVPETVAASPAA